MSEQRKSLRSHMVEDAVLYIILATVIAFVAVFFRASNDRLESKLLSDAVVSAPSIPSGFADDFIDAQVYLVNLRYRQAAFALYSKTVRRNAAFLVGTLLALVGALMIVRRIEGTATTITGEGGGVKANLAARSPGIVLAVLGTIIVVVTVATKEPVEVEDLGIASRAVGPGRSSATTFQSADTAGTRERVAAGARSLRRNP